MVLQACDVLWRDAVGPDAVIVRLETVPEIQVVQALGQIRSEPVGVVHVEQERVGQGDLPGGVRVSRLVQEACTRDPVHGFESEILQRLPAPEEIEFEGAVPCIDQDLSTLSGKPGIGCAGLNLPTSIARPDS